MLLFSLFIFFSLLFFTNQIREKQNCHKNCTKKLYKYHYSIHKHCIRWKSNTVSHKYRDQKIFWGDLNLKTWLKKEKTEDGMGLVMWTANNLFLGDQQSIFCSTLKKRKNYFIWNELGLKPLIFFIFFL